MSKTEAPQAPTKPQTPAEWIANLKNQKAQKEAELNQIIGALALAEEWEASGKSNGAVEK